MKPITDDVVLTLIEGAKRRQQSRDLGIAGETRLTKLALGIANGNGPVAAGAGARIISLDFARRTGRVRRTVSGLFCYAPRA